MSDATATIPLDNEGNPDITDGMKAECANEFAFTVPAECGECIDVRPDDDCEVCGGAIIYQREITVPWDVCKKIYKKMALLASR